jgi:hydroxyacylglutathione hydrolase
MLLETIESRGLAHLSYVVGDEDAGVCAVIDPRRDVSVYIDFARRNNCRITHIFETHIHADFVSGGRELAMQTGAQIVGGVSDDYGFEVHQAREGETFELGEVTLGVLHTPGHTPEHISLTIKGGKGSQEMWGVFTGDTLFAGEVGRPDLLGADTKEKLARAMFHTLREKLFTLGDEVEVYPAHGSGSPCGGSIGDRLTSTIGYERLNQEKARIENEDEFVQAILKDLPPAPTYYPRMKKVNAVGSGIIGCLPNVQPLDPQKFAEAAKAENALVVDVREIEAFGGGHIAGAMNIALRDEFPVWSGWMLKPEQTILLVLDNESEVDLVQRHLLRIGIEKIGGFLRKGMRGWFEAGMPFVKLEQMSVQELNEQKHKLQILDVRADGEWSGGHIPGAQHAFVPKVAEYSSNLDKSQPLAVYCGSGYRASIAASVLQSLGFEKVFNIPGSMKAWKSAGYELEK